MATITVITGTGSSSVSVSTGSRGPAGAAASPGADENYVTDAEKAVIGNTSGTNTGDQANITGNAATVTTNANLTGPVTSTGNATAIANGAITNAMIANAAVANLSGSNTGDQDLSGLVVKASNLSDLANASTARTNLGLGTLATQSGTFSGTSSGTNTGNETAASIATALNAGTEDTAAAAAGTDKIAVTHPAGGWMLLSTLWTYIKSVIDAGQTWAGVHAFSSTTRPTSGGTGVPSATDLITAADGDARFGQQIVSHLTTDGVTVNNSTTPTNSGLELTLPVGTWMVEGLTLFHNTTTAAGGYVGLVLASGTATSNSGFFSPIANTIASIRSTTTIFTSQSSSTSIGTGGIHYLKGALIVTVTAVIRIQFAQGVATATDSTVKAGSFLIATKIA